MVGATRVGKTQIINRIVNNTFSPIYVETLEKEVYQCLYNEDDNYTDSEYRIIEFEDVFPLDHEAL